MTAQYELPTPLGMKLRHGLPALRKREFWEEAGETPEAIRPVHSVQWKPGKPIRQVGCSETNPADFCARSA
jgi:hypothetical protein